MDNRKLIKQIYNDLNTGVFWKKVVNSHSHFEDRHFGISKENLLERALKEKHSTSCYKTEEDMHTCINESFCSNIKKITYDFKHQKQYQSNNYIFVFDKDMYDDVCYNIEQTGFQFKNGTLKEVTTTANRIAIFNDYQTPYGGTIHTAFPDMDYADAQPTGADLHQMVENSNTYKNADCMEKTFFDYALLENKKYESDFRFTKAPYNEPYIQIKIHSDDVDTLIFIKESSVTSITYDTLTGNRVASEFSNKNKYHVNLKHKDVIDNFKNMYPSAYKEYIFVLNRLASHQNERALNIQNRNKRLENKVLEDTNKIDTSYFK